MATLHKEINKTITALKWFAFFMGMYAVLSIVEIILLIVNS